MTRMFAHQQRRNPMAVECMFTWYWLADLWAQEGIPVVLGHARYMKAIHGGKAKSDTIDAHAHPPNASLSVVLVLPRPLRHAISYPSLSEQTTLEGARSSSLHSRGVNLRAGRHQLQVAGNRLSGVSATGWP
jgi:hypothetical protein